MGSVSKHKLCIDDHITLIRYQKLPSDQICHFGSKLTLIIHHESVHEEKRPYKCNICDANFARKAHLNVHLASIHEGKKPFQCNLCETSFVQKGTLKKHLASIHEGKHLDVL